MIRATLIAAALGICSVSSAAQNPAPTPTPTSPSPAVKPAQPSPAPKAKGAAPRVWRVNPPDADDAEPLRFDGLEIDARARRVTRDGEEVQLSQREFDLLEFFATNPGRAFSRDQLLDRVWGAPLADTSTVTVHVRRLRAKIEPDPERPRFIQTVWGVGYRFQP